MVNSVSAGVNVPKNIILTEDGKTYEKAGKGKSTGAVLAANMAGGAVIMGAQTLGGIPLKSAFKSIDAACNDFYKNAIDGALKKSGLAEKGVQILDATVENKEVVKDVVAKSLPKWVDKLAKKNKDFKAGIDGIFGKQVDAAIKGKNAFFLPKANLIAINKDKFSMSVFHEMGHAMNKHIGTLGKIMQKSRQPVMILTSLAMMTALFKRKKAQGEEPKGWFDKTTTFIKNNCGKLAFLGFAPTLIEEGMASFKGAKLAKGLLSPDKLKLMNKFNGKAWLTYAAMAVGAGLGTTVVAKVRDAIAHPKEIHLGSQQK